MSYRVVFSRQAQKDALQVARAGLRPKAERILAVLEQNPFQTPPPYEKLLGDLSGAYSRRLNIQHRIVYLAMTTFSLLRTWRNYQKLNCFRLTARRPRATRRWWRVAHARPAPGV